MRKLFFTLFLFSSISFAQPDTTFFPTTDHPTAVVTWFKEPDSGFFYTKVDESTSDPTVDIEYVYSSITSEPVIGNKKLKLIVLYAENPIFGFARFPHRKLTIRCSQTFAVGDESVYVAYTPTFFNKTTTPTELTDNEVIFPSVLCATDGTFSTVELDLGVDYSLPIAANGAVIEFRWNSCSDDSPCVLKISSVEVEWENFKITPIISE